MKALLIAACFAPVSCFGAWALFDDFDTYATGVLNGSGGWVADADWTIVSAPAGGMGLVASGLNSAASRRAYKPLSLSIANTNTATSLFFRMRRAGGINLSIGLSDESVPPVFTGFETQLNAQHTGSPNTIKVRDGAVVDDLGPNSFVDAAWYNVWMVVNNSTDTYQLWIEQGDTAPAFASNHILDPAGGSPGDFDFGFRNGAASSPLQAFFMVMGSDSLTGRFYVDDIYVDTSGQNLATPVVPEPASSFFILGGAAIAGFRRRRAARAA
jgi:hypothetical protein